MSQIVAFEGKHFRVRRIAQLFTQVAALGRIDEECNLLNKRSFGRVTLI